MSDVKRIEGGARMNPQAIVGIFAIAVTLSLFVLNIRRDKKIKKADLLRNYTNDFYDDKRITALFMAVDSKSFSFTSDQMGTDDELNLVRVLDFLNILGHNWREGVISLGDIAPTTLGYAAVQIHADDNVTQYLQDVEKSDEERYRAGNAFGYFRELAVALATYPTSQHDDSRSKRFVDAIARLLRNKAFRRPRTVKETATEVTNAIDGHELAG
ncbi:hypothetical protein [Mycobacterium sp. 23]|uniref:hypothetical protein n=1 Tax=Mycobacterium sp. 23 TaxID=3400424 RepID=UPI003AAD995D